MNINHAAVGHQIADRIREALEDTENRLDNELERLGALEDDDLELIRQKRRKELQTLRANKALWRQKGHGQIQESAGETEFFEHCKKNPKIFCQFSHSSINVERSQYLTKHMKILAEKYLDILFLNVDVEKHPFLIDRLNISVIPTVVCVIEMKMSHISMGFSELTHSDDWETADLDALLERNEMLKPFKPSWTFMMSEHDEEKE